MADIAINKKNYILKIEETKLKNATNEIREKVQQCYIFITKFT